MFGTQNDANNSFILKCMFGTQNDANNSFTLKCMFGTQNDANIHRISRKHKSTFKHLEHIRKTIACVQN